MNTAAFRQHSVPNDLEGSVRKRRTRLRHWHCAECSINGDLVAVVAKVERDGSICSKYDGSETYTVRGHMTSKIAG